MSKRYLVLGASGLIGSVLLSRLGGRGLGTRNRRAVCGLLEFDLATTSVRTLYDDQNRPDVCVLLASQSNIDTCAREPGESWDLNVRATLEVARNLVEDGIKPVFISSDTVFDGGTGNYSEASSPNPILTYGRQKLEVEEELLGMHPGALVMRLAKVVSPRGNDGDLFSVWLEDIREEREILCADDQFQSLIDSRDAADAICLLSESDASGIYHVGGNKAWSRAALFKEFNRSYEARFGKSIASRTCSIGDFDFAEARPKNTSLDCSRIRSEFGFSPRDVCSTGREAVTAAAQKP